MKLVRQICIIAFVFACLQPGWLKSQTRWTNHPENPVIGGQFDPGALFIQRPSVVFDGDAYHMWYASVRVFLIANMQFNLNCMGYATSPDGVSWQSVKPVVMEPSLDMNAFDQLQAGQGWVIADNDTFKMWYWGFNPAAGETGLNTIGYAWSLDGSKWNRVKGPGALGSVYDPGMAGLPDSLGLATPCVVKDGDTYHMWHSQVVAAPFIFRIGYARSSDGIHWTKVNGSGQYGSVIDWGPLGSFDHLSASWPAVIKTDEGFMMWYYGYDGTVSRTGCNVSSDGIQWNRAPGVDASGACFDTALGTSFENALGTCVIRMPVQYKMWYSPENSNLVNMAFSNNPTGAGNPDNPARPNTFTLEQNFPNPFNPSTTIEYTVQNTCRVSLAVFNCSGQTVMESVNAVQQPGQYSVPLYMHGIPSGIYFYKIRMGDFQAVRKMVKIE